MLMMMTMSMTTATTMMMMRMLMLMLMAMNWPHSARSIRCRSGYSGPLQPMANHAQGPPTNHARRMLGKAYDACVGVPAHWHSAFAVWGTPSL